MVKRPLALFALVLLAFAACRKPADPIPTAIAATQTPAGQKPATQQAPPAQTQSPQTPAAPAPTSAGQTTPPSQPPAAKPKPMPAELPDVLARVNGEDVRKADLDAIIRNAEAVAGRPIPAERRDEVYRAALEQLITFTMLVQEANARHVTVTDAELEQRMEQLRKTFPTEDAFKKALSDRSMSLERLRKDTQSNLLIDKMVQGELSSVPAVTDQEAQEFYEKNPEKFQQPEAVRASHILIKVDPKADEPTRAKARAEIDAIMKQAREGEDFAKLAQARSQDEGSAKQGGDLNYFTRERMVPQFSQVAFTLKPGEISDVVTTQFGYHIIKVTDRKPQGTVPLEQVKEQLKGLLQNQKKQERTQAFIAALRQKSKIEVLV